MIYDYIIVGAGTAGCVLANRLSANPKHRVLLIEAGGKDDYFWIDIPVGYLWSIGNPRTDWCFKTEPDAGLNDRSIGYARGKLLGGCSSINAMIYTRGQAADYDHWASLGNRDWAWEDVLPVFKQSEDYQHGADEFHGAGGELRVEERRVSWEILDAWREAAIDCEIPAIPEFNRGNNFGVSYFQMNQRRGVRWSATKGFLRPVLKRPNLTIITDCMVERIVVEQSDGGPRASGVQLRRKDGSLHMANAKMETLLAAGAIGSPQLLQLSGIGAGSLLQKNGIDLRHELSGVGENLHDHLQIRSVYKVHNTITLNRRVHSLWGKLAMGVEYFIFKTGPLTMPPSQLGAFARSSPKYLNPNIEWHVQPLSLDKFGDPLHRFDAITPSVCNLQPTSRGHVRIRSNDANAHPEIKLNYLSSDADREVTIAGLRFTRQIMASDALARFQPEELKPGAATTDDGDLLQAAGDLGTTIFHPVGTCKMGSDPLAVVDDRLRVHGVRDLRVIDASIMPRITSGNTNAPTVMIAEQGARFVIAAANGKTD